MSQHQDRSGPEDFCAVFEAGDNLRCCDVTGNPADEDVADGLIEHEFNRHTGIGTREDSGERLLLLGCLSMQHFKVVRMSRHLTGHVTLVAVHQFLYSGLRAERGLHEGSRRRSCKIGTEANQTPCCRRDGGAQKATSRQPSLYFVFGGDWTAVPRRELVEWITRPGSGARPPGIDASHCHSPSLLFEIETVGSSAKIKCKSVRRGQTIKIANRLRLERNPEADAQCPECGAGMKKKTLRLHFEECRVKAVQA